MTAPDDLWPTEDTSDLVSYALANVREVHEAASKRHHAAIKERAERAAEALDELQSALDAVWEDE